jgi:hypothetical protein
VGSPYAPLLVALAALPLVAGCRTPPDRARVAAGQGSVEALLSDAVTEGELTLRLGPSARSCVESTPGTRLCEWVVGDRNEAWEALARAIDTKDKVGVLCQLPSDGSPRAGGSCRAFPRRSDRYRFLGSQARRQAAAEEARGRVQAARTLAEISELVGAAPSDCAPLRDARRLCTWDAHSRTYGHGTLCVGLGLSTRERIRYRCELPQDGGPRGLESCRVDQP